VPTPSYRVRFALRPDVGLFKPDSFHHLLQQTVQHPALDRQHNHTLIDAAVADDGSYAELLVHSEPMRPMTLDSHIRFDNGTPPAHVRAQLADGTVLFEGTMPAPVRVGQSVIIGEKPYYVNAVTWPGRDPQTGVCKGDVDWEQATIAPIQPASTMPAAIAS
jgi:hypothetical protein